MPGHTRTVAVPVAHCSDADGGLVNVCDGMVASVAHVSTQAAVSTTCRARAEENL